LRGLVFGAIVLLRGFSRLYALFEGIPFARELVALGL
jgi:hypothetical protein